MSSAFAGEGAAPPSSTISTEKLDLKKFSGRALVLLFVSVECPISNSYSPEYRRLREEFEKRGVVFRLVYPNGDESEAAIRKHLAEFKLNFTVLRDPNHELVNLAKVHVTPEAAVFVPQKGWIYHGRIDDRYVALGQARIEAQQRDLHDVLAKVVEGKAVEPFSIKAVGCYIEGSK